MESRHYNEQANTAANARRPVKGTPRVNSAILNQEQGEQGHDALSENKAAKERRDAQSELVQDYEEPESTDSQPFSGIAVIDGGNPGQPDAQVHHQQVRGFKRVVDTRNAGNTRAASTSPGRRAAHTAEFPILRDDIIFSNMVIDDGGKDNRALDNQHRVMNLSRTNVGAKKEKMGASKASGSLQEAEMAEFKSDIEIPLRMIGLLNDSKTVKLDDTATMQEYIVQKGVPLMDTISSKLNQMNGTFDRQAKEALENVNAADANKAEP